MTQIEFFTVILLSVHSMPNCPEMLWHWPSHQDKLAFLSGYAQLRRRRGLHAQKEMNTQETIARNANDQGGAIDLLDPAIHRWKLKRTLTLLTVAKILAALVFFPAMFFGVFLCLWALAALIGSLPTVALTCVILVLLIVALSRLAYDRWLGDESVSYQGAVLSSLSGILSFAAITLFAFIIADLSLIDGNSHSLSQWCFYFGNLLSYWRKWLATILAFQQTSGTARLLSLASMLFSIQP
jgi:hypothetical protein